MADSQSETLNHLILDNIVNIDNGLQYQNLNELNQSDTVQALKEYFLCKQDLFKTEYWTYDFQDINSLKNSYGKFWLRSRDKKYHNLGIELVDEHLCTYIKWSNTRSNVICYYTSEDKVKEVAQYIEEAAPELYYKNISYKTDTATLSRGKSKLKMKDILGQSVY